MQPQNFDQFDIDHYNISMTSTSGIQNITTACGGCTSTEITVSEDLDNVPISTTFNTTIAAVNLCGETGPTATASYTLSKLLFYVIVTEQLAVPHGMISYLVGTLSNSLTD